MKCFKNEMLQERNASGMKWFRNIMLQNEMLQECNAFLANMDYQDI
jgi:hypothetical protein